MGIVMSVLTSRMQHCGQAMLHEHNLFVSNLRPVRHSNHGTYEDIYIHDHPKLSSRSRNCEARWLDRDRWRWWLHIYDLRMGKFVQRLDHGGGESSCLFIIKCTLTQHYCLRLGVAKIKTAWLLPHQLEQMIHQSRGTFILFSLLAI
jgi:hypothetical protein